MSKELVESIASLVTSSGRGAVERLAALMSSSFPNGYSSQRVSALRRQDGISPELMDNLIWSWSASQESAAISARSIGLALAASLEAATLVHGDHKAELVVTGPHSPLDSPGRPTATVALEIIRGAARHLLVVGYALTNAEGSREVLSEAAKAVMRGVSVTFALDSQASGVVSGLWPPGVEPPRLLIWSPPDGGSGVLHAKVIAADAEDALVTSANLTFGGLMSNLEIGIRVRGQSVEDICKLIAFLERRGLLRPASVPF